MRYSFMKLLWPPSWTLITIVLFGITLLDYITPPSCIFSYLYSGAILLSTTLPQSRRATIVVTSLSIGLIICSLVVNSPPGLINLNTLTNRFTVILALAVTAWLADHNRCARETIVAHRTQLEHLQKIAELRKDFASTLTHDLKPPLLGAVETIKAFQAGKFGAVTEMQQSVLMVMKDSHYTTLKLLQNLLDIYRHESEGLALRCEPLNLVDQAHTAVATLTDLASNRDIHLKIKTEAEELWIHGDPVHLQRVFINLILNGIHHSPRGKWVTIELIQGDLEHQVQIHDRGLGLSSSELVRLFERFYQADSDRQAQGSGLGLYLSRQIIEAHGGKIWAKNDHGQGAVFCFQLPRLNLPSAERSG